MNLISPAHETRLLQKVLEAKLMRVFYYTRYSLLVSGQNRLSHYCFFTNHAAQSLDQAHEIMGALVLLDAACDLELPYAEQTIQKEPMAALLRQAIADETSLLSLCKSLLQQIERKDMYFYRLARSLVIDTHQRVTSLVHLLHEVERKRSSEASLDLFTSAYTSLDYSSLRLA